MFRNSKAQAQFIPAPPGYAVIYANIDEGLPPVTFEYPVIAFRLSDEDGNIPITAHGEAMTNYDHRPNGLRLPDGRVILPDDRDFENVDAWLLYFVEKKEKSA